MWPTSSRATLGYGITPEMGMFVVAPATYHSSGGGGGGGMVSHHHHHLHPHHHDSNYITTDHSSGNNNSSNNAATALGVGVGVGVIPLLTGGPCLTGGGGVGGSTSANDEDLINRSRAAAAAAGAIHLWQNQHLHQMGGYSTPKKSINFDPDDANLMPASALGGAGAMTCQDCGNQAKKDCSHRRCRTCCRSRGFDCATHVKSTWVPAARRRERQTVTPSGTGTGGGGCGASSGSTSGAKKPRLISSQTTSHTSTSNTPPRSFDTSSSHQDASFKETLPGQLKAPAVFKCVRVTAVDDGEDEFAYQAVVKIGGHIFKGFLYDQGIEPRDGFPNLSDLHLGGGASTGGGGGNGASSSSPFLDRDVYGGGGAAGGLLGGSGYGNTIN